MSDLIGKYFYIKNGNAESVFYVEYAETITYNELVNTLLDQGVLIKEIDKEEYDKSDFKILCAEGEGAKHVK